LGRTTPAPAGCSRLLRRWWRGSRRRRLGHCRSCYERQGKKTSSYELPGHVILLTETVALEHTQTLGRQRRKAAYRSRPAKARPFAASALCFVQKRSAPEGARKTVDARLQAPPSFQLPSLSAVLMSVREAIAAYMFSPGIWWSGFSLNLSGSSVHCLQMNS